MPGARLNDAQDDSGIAGVTKADGPGDAVSLVAAHRDVPTGVDAHADDAARLALPLPSGRRESAPRSQSFPQQVREAPSPPPLVVGRGVQTATHGPRVESSAGGGAQATALIEHREDEGGVRVVEVQVGLGAPAAAQRAHHGVVAVGGEEAVDPRHVLLALIHGGRHPAHEV